MARIDPSYPTANQAFNAPAPLSISELNRLARETLESHIPLLWVAGELSNLTRAPSGHLYFTLKDASAQVRCTMWRNRAQLLPFRPENGMRVEVRALVTLYEARGDFQLNAEAMRPAGVGSLFEAFNRLKEKLAAEGLFALELKKPIPAFPRGIGVVTSQQAAALRDVLATLWRRAPGIPIVLYPAPVQGEAAPAALITALRGANQRREQDGIDLILLVRGGGSLEDLAAFNDEALARAIRASRLPVISGVGHETDFSIADFVADVRAATPTAAAELASAGYHGSVQTLADLSRRLDRAAARRLETLAQRVDRAELRLVHPKERLAQARLRLDGLLNRLDGSLRARLQREKSRLSLLASRLGHRGPEIGRPRMLLEQLRQRLDRATLDALHQRRDRLLRYDAALEHLNPADVLRRGYAIARGESGAILRDATTVEPGTRISVQLALGQLEATVDQGKSVLRKDS